MMILIYTMLPNSTGLFSHARRPHAPAFSIVPGLRWFIVVTAASPRLADCDAQRVAGSADRRRASVGLDVVRDVLPVRRVGAESLGAVVARGSHLPHRRHLLALPRLHAVRADRSDQATATCFRSPARSKAFGLVLNARLILLALCCAGAAESLRARGHDYREPAPSCWPSLAC